MLQKRPRVWRETATAMVLAVSCIAATRHSAATEPMKQAIFYGITEAEVSDPRLLEAGIADVVSRGFHGVYFEYRNVHSGCIGERFRNALRAGCNKAQSLGLGVIVDGSYARLADVMRADSPEVFSDSLLPCRVPIEKGCFTLTFSDEIEHRSIERCWLIEKKTGGAAALLCDVTPRVHLAQAVTEGGGCAMTEVKGRALARLTYRLDGVEQGELFVVSRRRFDYTSIDLSHPKLRPYVSRWIAQYRGLPLAGFAWDEPHFGFAFYRDNGRAISDHLYAVFQQRFGCDLRDRLADLWWDQPDGRSPLTRLHYAELLEQSLADLEADFARQAKERLEGSADGFIGIHRTMHEETGDDFYIGCCDYFRHNRHTSGGFTDSVFEREDSMATMLQLARSLAAANGGPAWNNSWGFQPREVHHAYYLRLMGAMQVRWLGHMYHSSLMFGPGYPNHPLWTTMKEHLAAHNQLLTALDGARPLPDTAVLYNWRAMAAFPDNYLHVHRRNLLLLGKALTYAQVQFQFVERNVARAQAGLATSDRSVARLAPARPSCPSGDPGRAGDGSADFRAAREAGRLGPPADGGVFPALWDSSARATRRIGVERGRFAASWRPHMAACANCDRAALSQQ